MRKLARFSAWTLVLSLAGIGVGCVGNRASDPSPAEGQRVIPLSTDNPRAVELFREGEDRVYKLRPVEAHEFFRKAVDADPKFAMGYWMLAHTSPVKTEVFANLDRAVELSAQATEPERLIIMATQAHFLKETSAEERYLKELVNEAPDDPRSHFELAKFYFNQQRFDRAIERFETAVAIDPDFFPAYNLMGYAYRALDRSVEAEKAYEKYIELLPEEANPLDSFAEFLMKAGRFEESIDAYRRALQQNPRFVPSIVGIANDYMFLDMPEEARAILRELLETTQIEFEKRQALFWIAASYIHEGAYDSVPAVLEQRIAMGQKLEDPSTVAQDLSLMGRFYVETGKPDAALEAYREAHELLLAADLPDELKQGADRKWLYEQALVELIRGNTATARRIADRYQAQVEPRQVPGEIRVHFELQGRLLLSEGQPKAALHMLGKANQQDPFVLLLTAKAARAAGELPLARDYASRAANFNGLSLIYGFVRQPAQRLVRELG